MATRPDTAPDAPLSAQDLAELRQQYGRLSIPGLQQVYADALERCKLDKRGNHQRPNQIQVLVNGQTPRLQAW